MNTTPTVRCRPALRCRELHATVICLATILFLDQSALLAEQTKTDKSPADIPVTKLESFTVTGSNIKRLDEERILPVTVMDPDAIEVRLAQTPVELLTSLPQVLDVPYSEAANTGSAARGDNASVALRGIGAGNTLVLLNGRRIVPMAESPSTTNGPVLAANVNTLPSQGLQQIELLRDGASSIYGTDAVAGVINFITNNNLRGTQVKLQHSYNEGASDTQSRFTLTHGASFASGRGHFQMSLDLYHRDIVFVNQYYPDADNTSLAPAPWNDVNVNSNFFNRSSLGFYGQFQVGTGNSSSAFKAGRPATLPASMAATSGTFYLVPNTSGTVNFKATTPSRTGVERDYYNNLNTTETILPSTDRVNIYGRTQYDLTNTISAYGEIAFYQAKSVNYRSKAGIDNSTDGLFVVPIDSPWNPFGSRFFSPTGTPNADGTPRLTGTPSPVNVFARRFPDELARRIEVRSVNHRLLAGLKGRFGDTWSWDSGILYTTARTTDIEYGAIRESLLRQNIANTNPAAEYNPFGFTFAVQNGAVAAVASYSNPLSAIQQFTAPFRRDGNSGIASVDFHTSGEVFKIRGRAISAAIGLEARRETFDDTREPFAGLNPPGSGLNPADNDFNAFSPTADEHAHRTVLGAYVETVVPITRPQDNIPLLNSFELSAAVRHDQYNDFGGATKPKIGLSWKPASNVMVRASYNEGFVAPNVALYYAKDIVRTASGTDTYRYPVTALPDDTGKTFQVGYFGNESIRPELSKGFTAGIVFEVPKIKGLSLSVDYWQLDQADLIRVKDVRGEDYDSLLRAMSAARASNTPISQIDLGSGTAAYKGSPWITRAPVTPADIAFFQAYNATRPYVDQLAPVGSITAVSGTWENGDRAFTSGVDLGAKWILPKTAFGRFSLSSDWAYMRRSYQILNNGTLYDERLGDYPATRWRGNGTLSWRLGNLTTGWSSYYYGRYRDTGTSTTQTTWEALGRPSYISRELDQGIFRYRYVVHDAVFSNAFVRYDVKSKDAGWLKESSVRVGLNNVFNKAPPLASTSSGYNSGIYGTMAEGRRWSVEFNKKY